MRNLRIFFTKTGEAAYISHLDLQRVFARALRKSGLPVWYSQGFNPHIYMSFALPLPLMQESVCESVDCKTEDEREDFSAFVAPLSEALPRGIEVSAIRPPKHEAGEIERAEYRVCYPGCGADVAKAIEGYNTLEEAFVERKTKRTTQQVDLKTLLPEVKIPEGECFEMALPAGNTLHYNPALVSGFLQQRFGLPENGAEILRMKVYVAGGKEFA